MTLILLHPEVADRDCVECEKWIFEDDGNLALDRRGNPIPRPPKGPPCRWHAHGCPKGTPEAKRSLTHQNESAYRHYLECKATGQFPDDPIVKRNAGIIFGIERHIEERRQQRLFALLEAAIGRPDL